MKTSSGLYFTTMNMILNRSASLRLALLIFATACLVYSCARTPPKPQIDPAAYAKEIDRWRAERWASLKSEDGWLTLVGLFWLKEGENKFGSDPGNEIVLPQTKIVPRAGLFILKDGAVRIETPIKTGFTVDGKPVDSLALKSDLDGSPTVLHLGSLRVQIIQRGDKMGVRVKDKDNPDRIGFRNTEFYPTNVKWRLDAGFDPYYPPRPVSITNVLGLQREDTAPRAASFEVAGK